MMLLLSSDTLPGAPTSDLVQACRRRALSGLELTLPRDQGRQVDESICPIKENEGARGIPENPDAPVRWLYVPDQIRPSLLTIWAGEAHVVGAGVLLTHPVEELPLAVRFALVHGTDVEEARRTVAWAERHGARTCWQVGPERSDLAAVDAILSITASRLAHVRLLGAGPEAGSDPENPSGTGMLLARLALNGFSGTVALAPFAAESLPEWEHWLLAGRGWGCGTAAEKQARAERKRVMIDLSI